MKKKKLLIAVTLILIFALILLFSIKVNASDDKIDPRKYNAGFSASEAEGLFSKAQPILTILRGLSVMVAVIALSVLGIKYMIGSVEQKASYKEKLIPIVIGAVLISGLSSILISINSIMNQGSSTLPGTPDPLHDRIDLPN